MQAQLDYMLFLLQHWSQLEPCPVVQSHHAAACLGYRSDNPQLLVTGGREAVGDAWILNINSRQWTRVSWELHKGIMIVTDAIELLSVVAGCS